jgi:hypothetical protein
LQTQLCWRALYRATNKISRVENLFQNPKNDIFLGIFKDSAIILDAILRSFLTKSATAAMFPSVRVDFGRPSLSSSTSSLPSRNREYRLKSLIGSEPHSHKPFTSVSVADRPALKQNFMATLFISAFHDG